MFSDVLAQFFHLHAIFRNFTKEHAYQLTLISMTRAERECFHSWQGRHFLDFEIINSISKRNLLLHIVIMRGC